MRRTRRSGREPPRPAAAIRRTRHRRRPSNREPALGALLFHGDFYRAAVALCGCHDNRVDKMWWNEQWMGYPIGPWYAENSNVTHAHHRAVLRRHVPLPDAQRFGQASPRITLHQKFPLDLKSHNRTPCDIRVLNLLFFLLG